MKKIVVGECTAQNIFNVCDPDAQCETEVEFFACKALTCLYKQYKCFLFGGSFMLDGQTHKPDIALVALNFSHWFIIEVELTSHSLNKHVLPQVTTFINGTPQDDCTTILCRNLNINRYQAETLLHLIPRGVAVIANKHDDTWALVLESHRVQFLSLSLYQTTKNIFAIELSGELEVVQENLGFGIYSAIDRSIRFPVSLRLPDGQAQINDPAGGIGLWYIRREGDFTWVTKERGNPNIKNGAMIQIIMTADGRLSLRRPLK